MKHETLLLIAVLVIVLLVAGIMHEVKEFQERKAIWKAHIDRGDIWFCENYGAGPCYFVSTKFNLTKNG